MPLVLPIEAVRLSWIFGLGAIFPIGLGISKILGINLNATGNPLGTLGGSLPLLKLLHTCIYHCVYEHT